MFPDSSVMLYRAAIGSQARDACVSTQRRPSAMKTPKSHTPCKAVHVEAGNLTHQTAVQQYASGSLTSVFVHDVPNDCARSPFVSEKSAETRRSSFSDRLLIPSQSAPMSYRRKSESSATLQEKKVRFSLYGNRVYPTYSVGAYDRRYFAPVTCTRDRARIKAELDELRKELFRDVHPFGDSPLRLSQELKILELGCCSLAAYLEKCDAKAGTLAGEKAREHNAGSGLQPNAGDSSNTHAHQPARRSSSSERLRALFAQMSDALLPSAMRSATDTTRRRASVA